MPQEFPEALRFPLGKWIDIGLKWLLTHYGSAFNEVTAAMLSLLLFVERLLLAIPWWLMVGLVALAAWRASRRVWMAPVMAGLALLVGALGLWSMAMSTLAIVGVSVLLSVAIGLPAGILMSRSNAARAAILPVLDAMQTMPSFVYLIPALMFFGLGKVPGIMATVIYAVPPVIRLTDLGIRQVSRDAVEAAEAFGSKPWQVLLWVQLPLARATIMAGINQTTMSALSMVVVSSMIGARGLGEQVLLAINRLEVGRGFEAGFSIVALAIVIDRITQAYGQRHRST